MDIPITRIGIVSDKTKLPYGFTIIEKSCDGSDDADLWKDGFLRRSYRYLCYAKDYNSSDVLVGLQIVNEREEIPTGFASIETTMDSNEKSMKKKVLCVKFVPKMMAKNYITDISIFSRTKRPPTGFTIVSELNNLIIAFKMVTAPSVSYPQINNVHPAVSNNFPFAPKQDEYSRGTLGRTVTPLTGVPFILSKKFSNQTNQYLKSYQNVDFKNATQIDKQYTYDFSVENSVLRDH